MTREAWVWGLVYVIAWFLLRQSGAGWAADVLAAMGVLLALGIWAACDFFACISGMIEEDEMMMTKTGGEI